MRRIALLMVTVLGLTTASVGVPAASAAPQAAQVTVAAGPTTPYSRVTITGSGFLPKHSTYFALGDLGVIATVYPDSNGKFSKVVQVPASAKQNTTYRLFVNQPVTSKTEGDISRYAEHYLWVGGFNPWASPSSWYTPPYQVLTFTGHNFAPGEKVKVYFDGQYQRPYGRGPVNETTASTNLADQGTVRTNGYFVPGSLAGRYVNVQLIGEKSKAVANTGFSVAR